MIQSWQAVGCIILIMTQLQVMEGWQVRKDAWYHWYLKVLRLPGQEPLVPQKVMNQRTLLTVFCLPTKLSSTLSLVEE